MALAKRRLNWSLLRQAMNATAKLSSFVIFILIGSSVFTLVFRGVNGDLWVESLLTSLPGGQVGFLVVVNLMVFVLAFFLDYFELAFIIVPLLRPVAEKLGIDLDLVRRIARDQHADLVPASAVRFRPLLFPQRGTDARIHRPHYQQTDGAGDHGADLLGQHPVRLHPAADGWDGHCLPVLRAGLARQGKKIDLNKIQIEVPQQKDNEIPMIEIK